MSYICEHCGKFVSDDDIFGSGRFCCRTCANSRRHSQETKDKISLSINKLVSCKCQFCDKEFRTLVAKNTHERLCNLNPNKSINQGALKMKEKRENSLYKTKRGDLLDVSNKIIEQYLKEHPTCEICGKTIDEINQRNSRYRMNRLCIDHNHENNTFRGVLCPVCNRQLGWYEKNKDCIEEYLKTHDKHK